MKEETLKILREQKFYKIINLDTGLFETGGSPYGFFNKNGKTWSKLSYVKSHLNQRIPIYLGTAPEDIIQNSLKEINNEYANIFVVEFSSVGMKLFKIRFVKENDKIISNLEETML